MPVFTSGGSQVGTAQINDGAILNADVNAAAGIARSKLADTTLLKVTHTVDQAVTTGETVVAFDTEVSDPLTAFASNVFTAPRAMEVLVLVNAPINVSASGTDWIRVSIRVNGAAVRRNDNAGGSAANRTTGLMIVDRITLAANDTLDVIMIAESTAATLVGGSTGLCLTILEV